VVSETRPLVVAGPIPTKKVPDPSLGAGQQVVEESGEPPRTTSVRRIVYDAAGNVLHDTVFYSSYVAEPKLIRVGTKKRPKKQTTTTTTSTTATTTTTTPPKTTTRP
jgi:uncharacterized protein YabE (DUF348 family)